MAVLHQRFPTAAAAQQTIQALINSGIAPNDVQLFTGASLQGEQEKQVGSFADVDGDRYNASTEPTGRFDDIGAHQPTAGEQRVGSFADENAHIGDARGERVGSFGDVDRDTETSFTNTAPHTQHPSHQAILSRLRVAGLSDADAQAHLQALYAGQALVLVDAPSDQISRVQALLLQA